MDWGDKFDAIVAAAECVRFPLDQLPCVATRVDPQPHLLFEWTAFAELRTDRAVGLDVGPIPWSSLNAYALRHAIVGEDFEHFSHVIRALDAAERNYVKDARPNAQP
jgi:hypothetical protein